MSKIGGLLDVNHKNNETKDKSIYMEEENQEKDIEHKGGEDGQNTEIEGEEYRHERKMEYVSLLVTKTYKIKEGEDPGDIELDFLKYVEWIVS